MQGSNKRWLIILTVLAMVMSAALIVVGLVANENDYITWEIRSAPESDVELIVKEITSEGITFVFDNPTHGLYNYGYYYWLHVHNGQEWVFAPSLPGMDYRVIFDIAYTISPLSTTDPIERIWYWAGSLPSGEYKFSTSISPVVWRHPLYPRFRGWIRDNDEHTFEVIFTIP